MLLPSIKRIAVLTLVATFVLGLIAAVFIASISDSHYAAFFAGAGITLVVVLCAQGARDGRELRALETIGRDVSVPVARVTKRQRAAWMNERGGRWS
jgi:acyl-coenzyme A synthetase/AMP-(fatty) acid ligase